jgi:hypothetical protein
MMKPFYNHGALLVCSVATLLLVGCGGGGGNPIVSTPFSSTPNGTTGLARLPSAQAGVPEVIHPDVASDVTILYAGRPPLKVQKPDSILTKATKYAAR